MRQNTILEIVAAVLTMAHGTCIPEKLNDGKSQRQLIAVNDVAQAMISLSKTVCFIFAQLLYWPYAIVDNDCYKGEFSGVDITFSPPNMHEQRSFILHGLLTQKTEILIAAMSVIAMFLNFTRRKDAAYWLAKGQNMATTLIFCICILIFRNPGFGPHIQKRVIDYKEIGRLVFSKLVWFLAVWYWLDQLLPKLVHQFMIIFLTMAVLQCIVYTWKYFKGFEF